MRITISLWLIVNGLSFAKPTPVKRALLISIATYNAAKLGWSDLPADRDFLIMNQVLGEQGFLFSSVRNEKATFLNISHEFQVFTASLSTGDIVVVHFSGHGQQISDDNGDEEDGWDEAFIPVDAPVNLKVSAGYRGEKHIRDDLIGQWISQIRARIGSSGHLLLLMDSCNSGDIARGEGSFRGAQPPFKLPTAVARQPKKQRLIYSNVSDYLERKPIVSVKEGRFVLITASGPEELNANAKDSQGRLVGSLTYAFGRAFRELDATDTYKQIFNRIANYMAELTTAQQPTLEGDSELPVFGGAFNPRKSSFVITDLSKRNQRQIQLAGGYISGLYERSKVVFNTISTRGAAPMAIGRVIESSLTHSWVALDSGTVAGPSDSLEAIITEKSFGAYRLGISLASNLPTAVNRTLKETINRYPALDITWKGNLILDRHGDFIRIRESATLLSIDSVEISASDAAEFCCQRMVAYAQANLLRSLNLTSNSYHIEAELVPVQMDENDQKVMNVVKSLQDAAYLRIPITVRGQLIIKNTGTKDAYITLIDIMPNGKTAILLPDPLLESQVNGYLLKAGQQSNPILFQFTPPYGTEVYKLIATSHPLGLSASRGGSGPLSAGLPNVLTDFFELSYRGQAPPPIPAGESTTATLTFQIVPPVPK